jgi:hypothetical protein
LTEPKHVRVEIGKIENVESIIDSTEAWMVGIGETENFESTIDSAEAWMGWDW